MKNLLLWKNYDENPIYTRNDKAKTHTHIYYKYRNKTMQTNKKNMKTYYKKNNLILLNLFVKQK